MSRKKKQKQEQEQEQKQDLLDLLGIGKEAKYKCSCPSCKFETWVEETFVYSVQQIQCPQCGDGLVVGEKSSSQDRSPKV